jgi:putative N-acetylmannosamine-6-phosphate epimerase
VSTKHEITEKPAAPEKTPAKAVAAAVAGSRGEIRLDGVGAATAVRSPQAPAIGTPKREYPTLGYE